MRTIGVAKQDGADGCLGIDEGGTGLKLGCCRLATFGNNGNAKITRLAFHGPGDGMAHEAAGVVDLMSHLPVYYCDLR